MEILHGGRTLQPSAEASQRAIQRALDKQAPFHRSKNSVADALILKMYVEVCAADVSGRDDHCFVTTNVKDFSLATVTHGDTRLPHADIGGLLHDAEVAVLHKSRNGYHRLLCRRR
jgi:hypothetical protein